jgi:hypothetical protein
VADRLGAGGFACSSGTISKLLNRKYPASTAEPERAVLAIYGGDDVHCPIWGPIPLQSCIRNRRRKGVARNPIHHQFADTCPACPNNRRGRPMMRPSPGFCCATCASWKKAPPSWARMALRPAPQPPFRSGETTRCIECSQWLVGRATAECAVCGAPAILASPITHTHFTSHRKG